MKTRIHTTRIIAYLVQYALVTFLFWFLRSHFFLMLFIILSVVPFLSIGAVFILRRFVEVTLMAPEREQYRDEPGYLRLRVVNRSWLFSFDANLILRTENCFFQDSGTTLLVIVSLSKKSQTTTEVVIYPHGDVTKKGNLSDMSQGMTESEETMKRGHDFSDVSDVREYIPGDKLMSIHWKLSAKRDILMVKDRVSMSDQQMVILTELSGEDEQVDEILSLTYGVCESFVDEQVYVRLMWWSEGRFAFEERQIVSREALRLAYADLYYDKVYENRDKTRELMRSIHPELKAYVHICNRNGEADAEVVEQD